MHVMRLATGLIAFAMVGFAVIGAAPALAWHHGHEHEYEAEERRHGPRLHIGPDGVRIDDGRHHRPRRHCREVSYHDHHGHHRTRVVCDH